MRFWFKYSVIFLSCSLAYHSVAGEDLPVPQMKPTATGTVATDSQGSTAVIEADSLEGKKGDQMEASGNVKLSQGGQTIRADHLRYKQSTHEVDAQGAVVLEQDGNSMSGPHLQFNLDSGAGTMQRPQYFLQDNQSRGAADVLNIQDRQHSTLQNASYTTCPAGNQDWQLNMGLLELDRDRQVGVAHNASVDFKGIPFLYTPWLDFPLNGQNKSGLLAPTFGGTSKGGTEFTLPYYWNMTPDHDATISPRLIFKRGLMLNDEFRYLEDGYSGELHVDALQGDKLTNSNRSHVSLMHNQSFTENLNGYVNYNKVSDDNYFRDLGDAVNVTSQVNLTREGGLSYNMGSSWNATALVQRFQTLQDPLAFDPALVPYARLPQLTLATEQNHHGATFAFTGEYTNFNHPTEVSGSRLVLIPSVSYPLVNEAAYYFTPKVSLHNASYEMGVNNTAALPNSSITLPVYSVDTGIEFERDSNMFGGNYVQTLEPRAYYVYVPYRDQSQLPVYDTALADFNFTQIFTENRFVGNDRIGDANQITLGTSSRLLDRNSGAERLNVMLGERFSFTTPKVNLDPTTTSTGKSDILLAASGQLSRAISLDSEWQYDPNLSRTQLYNIAAHYHPEPGKTLNLGYRYQRDTLRQLDLSTQWPLTQRWNAVGRWNYSFPDKMILDSIAGLEYNQSCWTLRLVGQYFTTSTQQTNTGVFVQLELKDFIKVGPDPLGMLKQSVPGYTDMNDVTAKPTTPNLQ